MSTFKRQLCIICKTNPQCLHETQKTGRRRFRKFCTSCYRKKTKKGKWKIRQYLKAACEKCGFIPVHICQLDVDHIDGNNKNNNPSNYQTLCANCHRLKTYLNKDFL